MMKSNPIRRVELHDVPENGPTANLDHRLWLNSRSLRETSTNPPAGSPLSWDYLVISLVLNCFCSNSIKLKATEYEVTL